MNQNRSGYANNPWTMSQTQRPESPGANQRTKALSYYFEGQMGSTTGKGLKSTFTLDPTQALGASGTSDMLQKFQSTDWQRQDPSMTNLPPNYYLGFGNKIKGPNEHLAKEYTRLREFGTLGSTSRDTAAGQFSMWLKATAEDRKRRAAMEVAAKTPQAHHQPVTGGEYQLGNMQGARLRAWERRQLQKQEELQKKKLQVVGPGIRVQKEASITERASSR